MSETAYAEKTTGKSRSTSAEQVQSFRLKSSIGTPSVPPLYTRVWGNHPAPGLSLKVGSLSLTHQVDENAQKWVNSPEQLGFLKRVLDAHIAHSTKKKGYPMPDLAVGAQGDVKGTGLKMEKHAAEAASRLLDEANRALEAARAAGDTDAVKTIHISATSGYRNKAYQERLWKQYFTRSKEQHEGYYNQTIVKRAAFSEGPHCDAAVRYMIDFIKGKIAAPGFSNHQAGLAIDFIQERTKQNQIANETSGEAMKKWHVSWLFKWLRANAARFGFEEYKAELWHWVYVGSD
jgi:LAS superfamily LD-carboxypeptidase LdcB